MNADPLPIPASSVTPRERDVELELSARAGATRLRTELFAAMLPAARAEVLHRLGISLLREGLVHIEEVTRAGDSTCLRCRPPGAGGVELVLEVSGDGPFLRYPRLERCTWSGPAGREVITHPLRLLEVIGLSLGVAHSEDRIGRL